MQNLITLHGEPRPRAEDASRQRSVSPWMDIEILFCCENNIARENKSVLFAKQWLMHRDMLETSGKDAQYGA
jgi:hypothetical protein